jgi:hypothetical protein
MRTKLKAGGAVAAACAAALAAVAAPGMMASASPAGHAAVRPAALPKLIFTMTGKKVSISGALQSGGVQVVMKVSGEAQGDPVLVRLDPGVTVAEFLKALPAIGQDQNNIDGIGAIVFSPQANKGTSFAQVSLAPGQYIALDVSSSGLPPLTTFAVSKSLSPARLPRPGATITSIEFAFRGPGKLHDGELVRFGNHGFLVHMIVAARAKNLKQAREIASLLKAGKDGKAQRLATGGYSFDNVLTRGAFQQQVIHNRPGYWVLACFMDTQDHREHTQLGMERVIRIVK